MALVVESVRSSHSGRPNDEAVPIRITSTARGTPATPLLVIISARAAKSLTPGRKPTISRTWRRWLM